MSATFVLLLCQTTSAVMSSAGRVTVPAGDVMVLLLAVATSCVVDSEDTVMLPGSALASKGFVLLVSAGPGYAMQKK